MPQHCNSKTQTLLHPHGILACTLIKTLMQTGEGRNFFYPFLIDMLQSCEILQILIAAQRRKQPRCLNHRRYIL